MSEHSSKAAEESNEQGRDVRGPACSPCVSLPARRSPSESRPSPASGGETERRPEGGQPARWEPEGLSLDPKVGIHPRFVTPGIENQNRLNQVPEPGMWCRADWIRLVGPSSMEKQVERVIRKWFGHPTGSNHGARYFDTGIEWHPGVLLSKGHSSKIVMVDLQGSRLAAMEPLDALKLATEIMVMGFHCTRIDLAVDHVMQDVDLYDKALASCEAKELCMMRRYSPDPEFDSNGQPMRKLLKLGKRDSDVCARIYDKGLETKTLPVGQWERFEVEFKGDRANEVCMTLIEVGDTFNETLWQIVIGSVDFRICNGRSELKRRPRSKWWSNYIGQSCPLKIKPMPMESSLDQWCQWFRKSAGRRLLQLADLLDQSPQEFFEQLIDGLEPAKTVIPAIIEAEKFSKSARM